LSSSTAPVTRVLAEFGDVAGDDQVEAVRIPDDPRADAGSWLGEILMSPEVNGLLPEWPLAGVGPTAISWPTAVE
jgi:hypothetical protein